MNDWFYYYTATISVFVNNVLFERNYYTSTIQSFVINVLFEKIKFVLVKHFNWIGLLYLS